MDGQRPARPGYVNFRDLGGHPTPDGPVRTGRVFRSDSLAHVQEPDVERLVGRLGIRTVVDLRGHREIEADPLDRLRCAGVTVHHVPLRDPANPSPSRLDYATATLIDLYRFLLDTAGSRLMVAVGHVADAANHPVVVQCAAGKDRTGLVAAVTLGLLGVADETIAADYARSAAALDLLIERVRARSPRAQPLVQRRLMTAEAATMRATIAHVRDVHGSFDGYARTYGLADAQIDTLRRALVHLPDGG